MLVKINRWDLEIGGLLYFFSFETNENGLSSSIGFLGIPIPL